MGRGGCQEGNISDAPVMSDSSVASCCTLLPDCWAVSLDVAEWGAGRDIGLFHVQELRFEVPIGRGTSAFAEATAGQSIAVVSDRTTGRGKDRWLCWEIAIVDPLLFSIPSEVAKAIGKGTAEKRFGAELAAATLARSGMAPRAA